MVCFRSNSDLFCQTYMEKATLIRMIAVEAIIVHEKCVLQSQQWDGRCVAGSSLEYVVDDRAPKGRQAMHKMLGWFGARWSMVGWTGKSDRLTEGRSDRKR